MIPYMPSCKTKLSKLNDEMLVSFMKHPFLKEMALGTLSHESFECYLVQDEMYLDLYAGYLKNISLRLSDSIEKAFVSSFAERGVEAERTLHAHLMRLLDGRQKHLPLCDELCSYDKFIRLYINRESVAFAFAAVLPCTWLYNLVGQSLLRVSALNGNFYREWIMAYSDEQYDADVNCFVDIALRYIESDDIDSCVDIYRRSAIHDLSLFDYAYKNNKKNENT